MHAAPAPGWGDATGTSRVSGPHPAIVAVEFSMLITSVGLVVKNGAGTGIQAPVGAKVGAAGGKLSRFVFASSSLRPPPSLRTPLHLARKYADTAPCPCAFVKSKVTQIIIARVTPQPEPIISDVGRQRGGVLDITVYRNPHRADLHTEHLPLDPLQAPPAPPQHHKATRTKKRRKMETKTKSATEGKKR